ncbi:phage portal protein [Sphingomonas lenta]|uniref:Phage portal protein n=1 Tax=Sphingomonas lenta TaxID=1141887 RepID=A0A2A2SDB0_9SPHN|nr:phage portal protein [Sphingomonas lenta]PAX07001.1 phage portal protein [Sphingomonas lenta]
MKWFGKRAARDDARPGLARGGGSGVVLGEWPRSYEAQVRDGYCGNAVAQRAVRLVAEAVGSAPVEASDPALAALVGARVDGRPVLETVAAQLMLHGNAYLAVLREGPDDVGELFPLRPERVRVELDALGWPAAYRYQVGERVTRFGADPHRPEIVHLKGFNPVDDHYGLGCLGAASGAVAVHNAAARWSKALLDNAARPSGVLLYEPGDGAVLSAEQWARVRDELDREFSGAANAGRPMILEGGFKWAALSLSPADMDFAGTRDAAAREIALAFGVPPMLLGLPGDNTYANYREANRALWRLTVLPLAGAVLGGIAHGVRGWFEDARLVVDLDRVPALAEERAMLWKSVAAADWLSDDEKRQLVRP